MTPFAIPVRDARMIYPSLCISSSETPYGFLLISSKFDVQAIPQRAMAATENTLYIFLFIVESLLLEFDSHIEAEVSGVRHHEIVET